MNNFASHTMLNNIIYLKKKKDTNKILGDFLDQILTTSFISN